MCVSLCLVIAVAFAYRGRRRLDDSKRICFVTGAGSGIGKSIVRQLLANGDGVIACDINASALEALRQELSQSEEKQLLTVQADVRSATSMDIAAETSASWLRGRGGRLYCIVNCAGLIYGGPLTELDDAEFSMVLDVNVLGTFLTTKKLFPLLHTANLCSDETGRGAARVVIMSSEVAAAQLSPAFSAPYSMSKFAVEAFATGLRQELGLLGLKVIVINPGATLRLPTKAHCTPAEVPRQVLRPRSIHAVAN